MTDAKDAGNGSQPSETTNETPFERLERFARRIVTAQKAQNADVPEVGGNRAKAP